MTAEKKTASIRPSSFIADAGLLDMSMEMVVQTMLEKEKRRHKESREDENEAEVSIGSRTVPVGVEAILESTAYKQGITRAMLTRCLSHQIVAWVDSVPQLTSLISTYHESQDTAIQIGRPDLCSKLGEADYSFRSSSKDGITLRSIAWARNKLSKVAVPLGVSTGTLFLIGICWSLSTSENELYKKSSSKFFSGEVDRFLSFVGARFIEVESFKKIVDYYAELEKEVM